MKKFVVVSLWITLALAPEMIYAGGGSNGYKVKTVVIDAGHGGHDPGAIGVGKVKEKNIALAVALKLGQYIKQNFPDVKVIYTRSKDEFIELHERASIANRNKADLFISIHCNLSPNSESASGTEVYVLGLHKTEEQLNVAKRENSVILMEDNYKQQYDGFDPNSPESHIIFSIYQDAFLQQSINLASKVDDQFKSRLNRSSRGVKQAGFLVLWKTTMPSILIELGFISNPQEEAFLNSQKGQSYMAAAIYRAFKEYKLEMEPNVTHNVRDKGLTEQEKEEPITMSSQKPADINKDTADDGKATTEEGSNEETKPAPVVKKADTPVVAEKTVVKTQPATDTKPAGKTTASSATKKQVKTITGNERPKAAATNEVVYKVQFMASKVPITPAKDPRLKKVSGYEVEHTDYYRFMVGSFSTLAEAKALQDEVRKKGFPEAFVVAYKDGVRVPIAKVMGKKA